MIISENNIFSDKRICTCRRTKYAVIRGKEIKSTIPLIVFVVFAPEE